MAPATMEPMNRAPTMMKVVLRPKAGIRMAMEVRQMALPVMVAGPSP
jgi:hypothetical protein